MEKVEAIPDNSPPLDQEAKDHKKFIKTLNRWKKSPYAFVQECLGVNEKNGLAISDQQKEFLDALGEIAFAKSRVWDHEHKIGPYAGKTEKQLLRIKPSVKDFELAGKRGISIMSGKGTGKDCASSWMIMWWVALFGRSTRVVCTSPNKDHLKHVLWSEITKWYNATDSEGNYTFILRDWIAVEAEKVYYKYSDTPGKERFAYPLSPRKDANPEALKGTLGGHHDDNMIVLMDEASAIPDPVFEGLETTLTSRRNFAVMLFNPLVRTGFAHDSHFKSEAQRWVKCQWNAEESNLVSKQFIESSLKKYGSRDSDSYRVYVRGLPPTGGEGTLIPFDWIYWAQRRNLEVDKYQGVVLGVDPAGEGKDRTMMCVRKGAQVMEMVQITAKESVGIAEEVMRCFKTHRAEAICVDNIGIGKGVYDVLNRVCSKVYGVKVSESPRKDGFADYRAELWWRMREAFEKGEIDIPDDNQLFEELAAPTYENQRGKIRVESKKNLKKRLGRSTDKADALMVTYHLDDSLFAADTDEKIFFDDDDVSYGGKNAWLGDGL